MSFFAVLGGHQHSIEVLSVLVLSSLLNSLISSSQSRSVLPRGRPLQ